MLAVLAALVVRALLVAALAVVALLLTLVVRALLVAALVVGRGVAGFRLDVVRGSGDVVRKKEWALAKSLRAPT